MSECRYLLWYALPLAPKSFAPLSLSDGLGGSNVQNVITRSDHSTMLTQSAIVEIGHEVESSSFLDFKQVPHANSSPPSFTNAQS
jgi:hypothetical protein